MNIFFDNLPSINLATNILMALVAAAAVISPRVRTTSIEVIAFGLIFLGSIINLQHGHQASQTLINIGVAIIGLFWIIRLEVTNITKGSDMKLQLKRMKFTDNSTIGELSINGIFECHTLEDKLRADGVKVKGHTAIQAGTYSIIINMSNRFKRELPLLLSVPMFEGIRIHSGNSPKDTEGCILVGTKAITDWVGNSRVAFNKLFKKMQDADAAGQKITIEIIDEEG